MIVEIGHILLIGALVISFIAGFSPLLRFLRKDNFYYNGYWTNEQPCLFICLSKFNFLNL
ncbi:MAG: hypothetical protein Ct9H300mP3_02570 [Gammaproteobacteria bacterium]|nr:MAG: hypothetical protein Ct9H300mP3_02570 [Gammaproteobacteria bacterium]